MQLTKKHFIIGATASALIGATALVLTLTPSGKTWYVRADGGDTTRCTGQTNAPDPGSGTAQACAYKIPQDAVNAATYGDTIMFHAGDHFDLPSYINLVAKGPAPTSTDADYITLTTDDQSGTPTALSGYPASRTRITTAMAANMPKLRGTDPLGGPIFNFPINTKYWKIERLELTNVDVGTQLIRMVSSDIIEAISDESQLPDHLIFQYNWFHPVEETGTPLDASNISRTVQNTFYLAASNVHMQYNSMQGFVGRYKYGGEAGQRMTTANVLVGSLGHDYLVENNLMEAWTYSVFAGGSGSFTDQRTTVSNCVGNPATKCDFSDTAGLNVGDPFAVFVSTSTSQNKWGASFVQSLAGDTVTFTKPLCQTFDGGNSCTDQNGTPANGDRVQWHGSIAHNLTFRRDIFAHYPEWTSLLTDCGGKGYFEVKACENCVFDGDTFTGCSGGTITARNQGADMPWANLNGLMFSNNYFETSNNTFVGFFRDAVPTKRSHDISWINNLMVGVSLSASFGGGAMSGNFGNGDNVKIVHNTVAWSPAWKDFTIFQGSGGMNGLVIQNNIFPMGQNTCWLPDQSTTQPVPNCWPAATVDHNVTVDAPASPAEYIPLWWSGWWGANNAVLNDWSSVGFMSIDSGLTSAGNYRLSSGSPYHNAGSDGKDIGVDYSSLMAALGYDPNGGPVPTVTSTPTATATNPIATPTVAPTATPASTPSATPTATPVQSRTVAWPRTESQQEQVLNFQWGQHYRLKTTKVSGDWAIFEFVPGSCQ